MAFFKYQWLKICKECFNLALIWAITCSHNHPWLFLTTLTSDQKHSYGFFGHTPHNLLIRLASYGPPPTCLWWHLNTISLCFIWYDMVLASVECPLTSSCALALTRRAIIKHGTGPTQQSWLNHAAQHGMVRVHRNAQSSHSVCHGSSSAHHCSDHVAICS